MSEHARQIAEYQVNRFLSWKGFEDRVVLDAEFFGLGRVPCMVCGSNMDKIGYYRALVSVLSYKNYRIDVVVCQDTEPCDYRASVK